MLQHILGQQQIKPSSTEYEFKMTNSFENRKAESKRVREKYPDKIPVIIEKSDSTTLGDIKKHKYLFQKELTMAQILLYVREQLNVQQTDTIILYVANKYIPLNSELLSQVYEKYADKDGFMYITYTKQEAYGV